MRELITHQQTLGSTNIENIVICDNSRDDIPDILKGLQYIYINKNILKEVLQRLENTFTASQLAIGRAGMDMWSMFVLATLRVNLNWDYDRLQHMANNHIGIREMLGRSGPFDDGYQYPLQTIKDNVHKLTPDILAKINKIVVDAGHELVKKKMTAT